MCAARRVANFFAAFTVFAALLIGSGSADEKLEGVHIPENSLPEESAAFLNHVKDVLSPKSHVTLDLVELPSKDFGLIIQNNWLSVMIEVPRSEVIRLQGYRVPEKARWLAQAEIAPAEKLDQALQKNYGLTLGEVYQVPKPPFYSDLKGIYWEKYGNKYIMVFTHGLDIKNNLCLKVVLDIERATILHESETRCMMR